LLENRLREISRLLDVRVHAGVFFAHGQFG
jgi:hypothetical protein